MIFQVPQFIEVEDKIFGPFTFKQFAYMAGGAASCFLIFVYIRHISTILAIIIMAPVAIGFLTLAFKPINGRPAIIYLEAGLKFFFGKKLFLWQKSADKETSTATVTLTKDPKESLPKLSESKLEDLAWSLDIDKQI